MCDPCENCVHRAHAKLVLLALREKDTLIRNLKEKIIEMEDKAFHKILDEIAAKGDGSVIDIVANYAELRTISCIGCGFCCRKSLCWFGHSESVKDPCSHLYWSGEKWRCFLIENDPKIYKNLGAGEGCCANLNTYQRFRYVPTPDDLKDEEATLKRVTRVKKITSTQEKK